MIRGILLVLVGGISLLYLSCASRVATLPESKGPQVEKEGIQKSVGELGWEGEWQKILTTAKKEGKVTFATSAAPATLRSLIENVRGKFGIELEYILGKGNQIAAKILAERNAGLYSTDVFISGPTTFTEFLEPVGAIEPLEPVLILPQVKDPHQWSGGVLPLVPERKLVLMFVSGIRHTVVYNTELVRREEISSFWNLLEPKWKEKMVLHDPTISGGGSSFFRVLAMELVGLDYFKKLVEQKPVIIEDQRLLVEWVAKGKKPIGLGGGPEMVIEFQKAGAPVDLFSPKEGSYVSSSGSIVGLMNKALHPNAARVFINFLLSKEGQDIWAVNEGLQSLRLDATTKHLRPQDIRQEGVKYISTDLHDRELKDKYVKLAKEVFAPLLKAR